MVPKKQRKGRVRNLKCLQKAPRLPFHSKWLASASVCHPLLKILLSSAHAFSLLVFLRFVSREFLLLVHLLCLGSILNKVSGFLFIVVEDFRKSLAGKRQEFEPRCVECTEC